MDKLKQILWPFAALYGGIMSVRNTAYDKGWFGSRKFQLPVIAVGNLSVGGTGKTPHVEYLLRLLSTYKTATLSRGYKRSTKGFILADEKATALTIGDEPYQYYSDFKDVRVAVSEDRVAGVEQLLQARPELQVIVLDDAMQHRAIQPSLNLLITDYNRPFYDDFILPAGLLRESKSGARRADAIIVSKCPAEMPASEKEYIAGRIQKYSQAPVYFTAFKYGQLVPTGNRKDASRNVFLLTGIANPKSLKHYLKQHQFNIKHHADFPDHYAYTVQDLQNMEEKLKQLPDDTIIITTRKDAVKLLDGELAKYSRNLPLFYIPIEVYFTENGNTFDTMVLQHVNSFYSK